MTNKLLKYVKTDSVFEDYTIFILFIRCIRHSAVGGERSRAIFRLQ